MKKIIALFCLFILQHVCHAQENTDQKISLELQKLAQRYKHSSSISFDIVYRYAAENKPGEILDSMSGSFKIHDSEYWYRLANTEAAGNSSLLMMLFKEDGIMYLSKPSPALRNLNPVAMLDSLISDKKISGSSLSSENGYTKIILTYRPGMMYKTVEYDIDIKSGLLAKMTSVVEAKQFYDPSVRSKVTSGTFAIVEADFTNYRENEAGAPEFNLSRYFKKVGNEYKTVPPYDNYKIFIGSTNL